MSRRREIERRLERFSVPPPGDLVRTRALAAGRDASRRRTVPDVWERIWSSTLFRLSWAAAVIVLAAGHLLLPPAQTATVSRPRTVERMLGAEASDELVAGLFLPPLDRQTLARWGGIAEDNDNNGDM